MKLRRFCEVAFLAINGILTQIACIRAAMNFAILNTHVTHERHTESSCLFGDSRKNDAEF